MKEVTLTVDGNKITVPEGTLIIDLVDAKAKEMVWRGMASKALASSPSAEKMDENVKKVVAKVFENYPPGK